MKPDDTSGFAEMIRAVSRIQCMVQRFHGTTPITGPLSRLEDCAALVGYERFHGIDALARLIAIH